MTQSAALLIYEFGVEHLEEDLQDVALGLETVLVEGVRDHEQHVEQQTHVVLLVKLVRDARLLVQVLPYKNT